MGYTTQAGSTGSISKGGQYNTAQGFSGNYGNDILAYLASAAQAAADAQAALVGAMPVGGGSDHIFYENGTNVTTNYTITSGKNAMSAGPVTINNGVVVTIPTSSVWTVV